MEYAKSLKSATVKTRKGSEFTVSDTQTAPNATSAVKEAEDGATVHIHSAPMGEIPFHAIDIMEVTDEIITAEKGNPRGCYAGNAACGATVGC